MDKKVPHEQQIQKRLNERKFMIQECKVQKQDMNDPSSGNQSNTSRNESRISRKENADMSHNVSKVDQHAAEPEDEHVLLASLIAKLKLDVDENKKSQKQLKKANTSLTQELEKSKQDLEISKFVLLQKNQVTSRRSSLARQAKILTLIGTYFTHLVATPEEGRKTSSKVKRISLTRNTPSPLRSQTHLSGDEDKEIDMALKKVSKTISLMEAVHKLHDPQCPGFGDWQWRLATLPIKLGGLGILSAGDIIQYAFLASHLQTNDLQAKIPMKTGIDSHSYSFQRCLCTSCNAHEMDQWEDHAVHCCSEVGVKFRHNLVRDILVDICSKAEIIVRKEAPMGFLSQDGKDL
uniref:Pentatricopeptide repeat (PPR) superfamily protein n=1 Tax=Tanacetum cinerariifolium TaxID=118510 RepID=A0A6L2J7F4_TANCI|nr:pentatricopeptide repeat (PPR) superfamily protein [Tanacetum cinerariifolium]